jgi:hypothetical protein
MQLTAILTEDSTPHGLIRDFELAEMIDEMRRFYAQGR